MILPLVAVFCYSPKNKELYGMMIQKDRIVDKESKMNSEERREFIIKELEENHAVKILDLSSLRKKV